MFKPLSNARIDIEQWLSWVKLVNHQKTTKSFTRKKNKNKLVWGWGVMYVCFGLLLLDAV